ncbi:hypothetical protein RhiXN_09579 [Rhizoctonia solani]|uniref:Uncharacterized protein n=1 Tax=Rhizoctonia solani TaxID=456999 RepID=A0A8H8P1J4_9AGAM|nr:uncharacterized protein RhiXN_09579 [Rhizoctonia solani]QRW21992.1 hypothetical protein RhiXN_09579 [Rhizoctonia solani]
MKYASVIVPLVLVGVLFLFGCIWVATRGEKDDGDEESALESPEPRPSTSELCRYEHGANTAAEMIKPDLAVPIPAHPTITMVHHATSDNTSPRLLARPPRTSYLTPTSYLPPPYITRYSSRITTRNYDLLLSLICIVIALQHTRIVFLFPVVWVNFGPTVPTSDGSILGSPDPHHLRHARTPAHQLGLLREGDRLVASL